MNTYEDDIANDLSRELEYVLKLDRDVAVRAVTAVIDTLHRSGLEVVSYLDKHDCQTDCQSDLHHRSVYDCLDVAREEGWKDGSGCKCS